jgi:hypothetical protein
VTGSDELARGVYVLAGVLAALMASAAGVAWGWADLGGALVGSAVTLLNFAGLRWATARLAAGGRQPTSSPRPALWLSASGARLLLVGLVLGGAIAWGGVGLRGLLVSLLVLPGALVVAGLRGAAAPGGA